MKRISSVHRKENQAKKICIDEALIEYDDAVEEESTKTIKKHQQKPRFGKE